MPSKLTIVQYIEVTVYHAMCTWVLCGCRAVTECASWLAVSCSAHLVAVPPAQVMANPKIPEPNKQLAQQQFNKLWTNCHETISNWVESTCSSPNFAILQPAMAELASSIDVSVLMDDLSPLQPNRSREAGTLMEAAAVQVRG